MRCTRCDRLAVPQAIGITPEGDLVFGWCLECLEGTGCSGIEVAPRHRRSSTRLSLHERVPLPLAKVRARRRARARARALERAEPRPRPGILELRRKIVAAVAGLLGLWGLVLVSAGLTLRARRGGGPVSPLGNGTPALLIGGGATTALVGLSLWAHSSGSAWLRSPRSLRLIQAIAFLIALGVLIEGIIHRFPQREPAVVILASLALAVSIVARLVELRWLRRLENGGAPSLEPRARFDES